MVMIMVGKAAMARPTVARALMARAALLVAAVALVAKASEEMAEVAKEEAEGKEVAKASEAEQVALSRAADGLMCQAAVLPPRTIGPKEAAPRPH